MDTTGAALQAPEPGLNFMLLFPTPLALVYFQVPYFTDAGNLNTLVATDGDYPDRVLLTWELTEGGRLC